MPEQPTIAEVDRKVTSLEDRIDRERGEMLAAMERRFDQLDRAISNLQVVDPEVFRADQGRQDETANRLESEIRWTRRLLIGSLLVPIAVALVWLLLVGPVEEPPPAQDLQSATLNIKGGDR